ncbi:MAG TPA: HEAT repeat domain-containing protein [Methanoculleus sp.]|nr:HEAT repeat domain-containing protein [Methanoculleus sp.]
MDHLDRLIRELKHRDWEVRSRAVATIGEIDDPGTVLDLIRRAGRETWPVRDAIAHGLGRICDRRAIDALNLAIRRCPGFIPEAVRALSACNADVDARALIGHLGHAEPGVRMAAADALGGIRAGEAAEPLAALLGDDDAEVRRHAARALGMMGDRRSANPLVGALSDADPRVRRSAAHALGRVGGPLAREALEAALHDPDRHVVRTARAALAAVHAACTTPGSCSGDSRRG